MANNTSQRGDAAGESVTGLDGRVVAGRYRVAQTVSSGASLLIVDAVDLSADVPVTLKVVRPEHARDEEFRRKFRRLAELSTALRHPNIGAVLDWGDVELDGEGTVFWAAEALGGGSMRDLLDRGRLLSPSQALVVGLEACRALDEAHQRGMIHTEITPSKMVFGIDRRLRVIDFGMARLLGEQAWQDPAHVPTHVARYASPEQAVGAKLTGKTDVYSLSLVLLEAVTGSVPFAGDSTTATLAARVDKLLPVSADLGSLAAVLERAARPDPDDRSSAAEFGRALVQAAEKLPRPDPIPVLQTGLFDTAAAAAAAVANDSSDPDTPDADDRTDGRSGAAAAATGAAAVAGAAAAGAHVVSDASVAGAAVAGADDGLAAVDGSEEGGATAVGDAASGDGSGGVVAEPAGVAEAAATGIDEPTAPSDTAAAAVDPAPVASASDLDSMGVDQGAAPAATGAASPSGDANPASPASGTDPSAGDANPASRASGTDPSASDANPASPASGTDPSASDDNAVVAAAAGSVAVDPDPAVPPTGTVPTVPTDDGPATAAPVAAAPDESPNDLKIVESPAPVTVATDVGEPDAEPANRTAPMPTAAVVAATATAVNPTTTTAAGEPVPESAGTEPYDDEVRRRKGPIVLLVFLIVAGLVALGFAAWLLLRTKSFEVPDLAGAPADEALNEISGNGWIVTTERERSDTFPEPDTVIRTAPGPGVVLDEGADFTLVLSDGPEFRALPEIRGTPVVDATVQLLDLGLIGVEAPEREFSEDLAEGVIIRWVVQGDTTLEAGGLILPGESIVMTVSKGPSPRSTPNLANLTVPEATASLESLQLEIALGEEVFSDDVEIGRIVTQTPPPEELIERGGVVTVQVSKGVDLVTLPDLEGLPFAEAQELLLESGFVIDSLLGTTDGTFVEITVNAEPFPDGRYRRGTGVSVIFL